MTLDEILKNMNARRQRQEALSEDYAARVGLVAVSWNFLCVELLSIFECCFKEDDEEKARSIWHCLHNDSSQRQILIAAANVEFRERPAVVNDISWICSRADAAGAVRNAYIHTSIKFEITYGEMKIIADKNSVREKVIGKIRRHPPTAEAKNIANEIKLLAGYAREYWASLRFPELFGPSPDRPKLKIFSENQN